jgi:spermidine/putrescine transport system substrate-binding protein
MRSVAARLVNLKGEEKMRKSNDVDGGACLLAVPVASAAEELRIFTWSEYMDEEKMPADFERKFGIKVRLDIYENNEEMVAKLQAGGVSQYDIIVPSDYIMPVLINQKLIQPLDHAKIPNLATSNRFFVKPPTIRATNIPWPISGARWA